MFPLTERYFKTLFREHSPSSLSKQRAYCFLSAVEKKSLDKVKEAFGDLQKEKALNVMVTLGKARLLSQSVGDKAKETFLVTTLYDLLDKTGTDKTKFFRELYKGKLRFEVPPQKQRPIPNLAKFCLLLLIGSVSRVAAQSGFQNLLQNFDGYLQVVEKAPYANLQLAYSTLENTAHYVFSQEMQKWDEIRGNLTETVNQAKNVTEETFAKGIEFIAQIERFEEEMETRKSKSFETLPKVDLEKSSGTFSVINTSLASPIAERFVEKGHLIGLKVLYLCGYDFNRLLPSGNTLLIKAAERGSVMMVRALTKMGADSNLASQAGITPLYQALSTNRFVMASHLIDARADFRFQSVGLFNKLAEKGKIRALKYLLKKGASPHEMVYGGNSLHFAAFGGDRATIEFLINHRVSARQTYVYEGVELTPHCLFKLTHDVSPPSILAEEPDCNFSRQGGFTPLYTALWNENYSLARLLIRKGAIFNYQPDLTLLGATVLNNQVNQIVFLVKHGANVNELSTPIRTPLHLAAWKGNATVIETLLRLGASANIVGTGEEMGAVTPLIEFIVKHVEAPPQALVQADTMTEKILAFKTLVHALKIRSAPLQLEGFQFQAESGYSRLLSKHALKAFNQFTIDFPTVLTSHEIDVSTTFFQNVISSDTLEDTLQRIHEGVAVQIETGFNGHTVIVFAYENYFVIANKGPRSRRPLEVYQFDRMLVQSHDVAEMKYYRNRTEMQYNRWLQTFPGRFNTSETPLSKEIDELYPYERVQIAVNCAYESQDTAHFALLSITRNSAKAALEPYVTWVQYNQWHALDQFFKIMQKKLLMENMHLLNAAFARIWTTPNWNEKVKKKIDELEEEYFSYMGKTQKEQTKMHKAILCRV